MANLKVFGIRSLLVSLDELVDLVPSAHASLEFFHGGVGLLVLADVLHEFDHVGLLSGGRKSSADCCKCE